MHIAFDGFSGQSGIAKACRRGCCTRAFDKRHCRERVDFFFEQHQSDLADDFGARSGLEKDARPDGDD